MSLFVCEAMGHIIPYYLFTTGNADEDNDEWRRTERDTGQDQGQKVDKRLQYSVGAVCVLGTVLIWRVFL